MSTPVQLVLTNSTLRIDTPLTDKQHRVLDRMFSFFFPDYNWMPLFKKGHWDGKKHFFSMSKQAVPAGFLPILVDYFTEMNVPWKVRDLRNAVTFPKVPTSRQWFDLLVDSGFDPQIEKCLYQRNAILALKRGCVGDVPFQRGILSMGTGAGKTLCAGLLPLMIQQPVLYTIFRLEIAYQTKEVWEKLLGEEVGLIGDTVFNPKRVTVAMTQSILSKLKQSGKSRALITDYLRSVRVWIADEAHRDDSSLFKDLSVILTDTPVRVGFSGSIFRKELTEHRLRDAQVHATFGKKLFDLPTKVLRDKGLLSEIHVHAIPIKTPRFGARKSQYQTVYTQGVVENPDRNDVIARLLKRFSDKKLPTLCICTRVGHCVTLQRLANASGLRDIPVLTGRENAATRKFHLDRFRNGEIFSIISSIILDIGVDLPDIERLIIAAGGKGGTDGETILQRAGRAMRPKPERGNVAHLYDFADSDPCFLNPHFNERLRIYREEAFVIEPVKANFNPDKAV